ncbi:MAG: hypothetical protein WCP21_11325 [Armatimonadota bacterium]
MKHCLIIAGILLVMSTAAFAAGDTLAATQTFNTIVDSMAVLHSNGAPTPVTLEIVAPTTGGDVPADVTATASLAYTNIQSAPFKIGAKISSGTVPVGTLLKLVSAAPAAQYGAPGTAATQIILNGTTSQPVVTAIGSCATGNKAGAALTYTFGIDAANWATLVPAATAPITVTYTLSSSGG